MKRNRRTGISTLRTMLFVLAACLAPIPPASAHPHVWIDMVTALQFDEEGRIAAIEVRWTFDEFYSAFAVEGAEKKEWHL